MGFTVLLSMVVLSSCLMMNAFGDVDESLSWTKAPANAPLYPPMKAPAPHHHRHNASGGHHHHKPASPPVAHAPSKAPAHAPSYPPMKAPSPHHHHHNASGGHHHHKPASPPVAHAPSKAPVHAPSKAPVQPPSHKPASPPVAHAPSKAPVHAPNKAPVQPPRHSPAPVHPPVPSPRSVAVQGVVYCKACQYRGILTLLRATPLQGAVVLLTCNNSRYPLRVKGTTDKNGYFFIMPPKTLTTYAIHTCRVALLTSPKVTCKQPTNLNYGIKGAALVPSKPRVKNPLPYDLFTVGPFAFEAPPKTPCRKL